jgi:hypothetical protein
MIPVILEGNVTFTSGMIDNGFAETDAKDGLYLILGDVDGPLSSSIILAL